MRVRGTHLAPCATPSALAARVIVPENPPTMLQNLLPPVRLATPFPNQTSIIHGGDYNPDQWLPMVLKILAEAAAIMRQTAAPHSGG